MSQTATLLPPSGASSGLSLLGRLADRFDPPVIDDILEPVTLRDLKVLTPEGDLVPFVLNPPQRILMRKFGIDPDDPNPKIHGRKWRKRVLKARREGITTLVMALFFLDTYNNSERLSVCVAHDSESATKIFGIVQRFYRYLPEEKKRKAARNSDTELLWPDTNSHFIAATAGSDDLLSGATIHNLHKSERAKWRGDQSSINALDASLNIAARWGNIIEETTAKGLNHFYKDWKEAQSGVSLYQAVFLAWFLDPRNREKPQAGFTRTTEEEERAQAFGLDDEQLEFYRQASIEHKELVKQEYPHTAEEAFLASGNPVFNREFLYGLLNEVNSLEWLPPREETPENSAFSAVVTTYDEVRSERSYLIVADPSEGLNDDNEHDYSVAHIYDRHNWEQVCHYRGKPDTHQFGIDLNTLGCTYNDAWVVVLRNNHGHSVLNTLLNQCNYGNVYYHKDYNQRTKQHMLKPGFPETPVTKPAAVEDLTAVINVMIEGEDGFIWHNSNTIEELIHYVKKAGRKTGNEPGSHDDEVSVCYVTATLIPDYAISKLPPPNWDAEEAAYAPAYGGGEYSRRGR